MTRRRILIAAVLTLWCWGCEFAVAADIRDYGARLSLPDNSKAILAALKYGDCLAEIPSGRWKVDGTKFRTAEWKKLINASFTVEGVAPANGAPQHTAQGFANHLSTIVVTGLKPGEPWLTFKSEEAGAQQFINVAIERENAGPLFQDDKTAKYDYLKTAGRGFLLQGVGIATSVGVDNYVGLFKGGELPPSTGAAIDLYNRADVTISGVSVTGFETQLKLDKCEVMIDHWRGMNCGRSILITDNRVSAEISFVRIENVLISGIDVMDAKVSHSSVEVGYATKVGYHEIADGDLRRRLPENCVCLVDGTPVYVESVGKDDFTHYLSNSHCELPKNTGKRKLTAVLGIPYIMRGDGNELTSWTPKINRAIDLPVAAGAPFRKPIKSSGLSVGMGDSVWLHKQKALYIGDAKDRQFAFQRGWQWMDEPTFAPEHPFVYGMNGPGFDPNKRETPK